MPAGKQGQFGPILKAHNLNPTSPDSKRVRGAKKVWRKQASKPNTPEPSREPDDSNY
jgi:hypothetical protein